MADMMRERVGNAGRRIAATLAVSTILGGALVAGAPACADPHARAVLQQAVCWGLVVGGVTGTFLVGAGVRRGWLVLLGMQPVWIAYAVVTGQPGFVLGSVAYAGAQLNGYLHAFAGAGENGGAAALRPVPRTLARRPAADCPPD